MIKCKCCTRHVPAPTVTVGIDIPTGRVYICPTGLLNLEDLLKQYDVANGTPPGSVTKHYGKVIRDLAGVIYSAS